MILLGACARCGKGIFVQPISIGQLETFHETEHVSGNPGMVYVSAPMLPLYPACHVRPHYTVPVERKEANDRH